MLTYDSLFYRPKFSKPRVLKLLFKRDPEIDGVTMVSGIEYTGYKAYWPYTEDEVDSAIVAFCNRGIRTLFGPDPQPEHLVDLVIQECEEDAPRLKLPKPGVRCRRLQMKVLAKGIVKLYFVKGIPTELEFVDDVEDIRIMNWLHPELYTGSKEKWFDLIVVDYDQEKELPVFVLHSQDPEITQQII